MKLRLLVYISFIIFALDIFANLWWSSIELDNEFSTRLTDFEKTLAKKNGNAFLYVLTPKSGLVWSYIEADNTTQIVKFHIRNNEIRNETIPYNRSCEWVYQYDSIYEDVIYESHAVLDGNSFEYTIMKDSTEYNHDFFCDAHKLISIADSLISRNYWSTMISKWKKWDSDHIISDSCDANPDCFFVNLSNDLKYIILH